MHTHIFRAGTSLAAIGLGLMLADTERDSAFAELRIAMRSGAMSGYVSCRGRWGRGDDDARVSIGASYAF